MALMGARELYWKHIEDKIILAIQAEPVSPELPGTASYWRIDFYVEGYRLALTTNPDTDEIIVAVEPAPTAPRTGPAMLADLRGLVGRSFGWNWSAVNSQGYSDMLNLAFTGETGAGVTPQLAVLAEATTINVHRICSIGDSASVVQAAL